MEYYSGNYYLNLEEMKVNAEFIYNYLTPLGWSINAISGMLGNMETESTINPAIWQSLDLGNLSGGFGLVQWTPATNYIDWAISNNLDINMMESNLQRIEFELYNNLQWISTPLYDFTFEEFKVSTSSADFLAKAFLANYERPYAPDPDQRGAQGEYWYKYLYSIYGKKKGMPLIYYLQQS